MAQIEHDQTGVVRLLARDAHARPSFGRDGLVVDAHVQRVPNHLDEACPFGGVAVDIFHEPVRWVGTGEKVKGVQEAPGVEVVLEGVASGAAGDDEWEEGQEEGQG